MGIGRKVSKRWTGRRRSEAVVDETERSTKVREAISFAELKPHIQQTLFITGAFCTAWVWDLTLYSATHAFYDENPLENPVAFGNQRAPKDIWVLLLQYLIVCGGAALFSDCITTIWSGTKWSGAAKMAIEFFPSPVFAGKLMSYLGQKTTDLSKVEVAIVNLMAAAFAAIIAHLLPLVLESKNFETHRSKLPSILQLKRFIPIVQTTLGFGLGIAWNVFLGNLLLPPSKDSTTQLNFFGIIGLGGYLTVAALLAFRLAAISPTVNPQDTQISKFWDRMLNLLEFASYVIVGFTLVSFLGALLHDGWLGKVECLVVLLLLAGACSALVQRADLERDTAEEEEDKCDINEHCPMGWLVLFVPCAWCFCPWMIALYLLAGVNEDAATSLGVKKHWFKLLSMCFGLATSIEASGMLTEGSVMVAQPFCTPKDCDYANAWKLVGLQAAMSLVVTLILIPLIARFCMPDPPEVSEPKEADGNSTSVVEADEERGEKKPLLSGIKKLMNGQSKSTVSSSITSVHLIDDQSKSTISSIGSGSVVGGGQKSAEKENKPLLSRMRAGFRSNSFKKNAYSVTVPEGIKPGQQFRVAVNGQQFMITCPSNAKPGSSFRIVPPSPPIATV